jgi:hypothetical protein
MVDAKNVWSVENPSVAEKMRQPCPCVWGHVVGAGVEVFPPVAKDDRGCGWGLGVCIWRIRNEMVVLYRSDAEAPVVECWD